MGRSMRVCSACGEEAAALQCATDQFIGSFTNREVSMDLRPLDDLAKKLAASVPEGLIHLRDDLEKNFRSVLQSGLAKLDVVTRQEFDVQAGVLKRTREKLEALEARLAELEAAGKK
jgi:BMFP domain-containing protein YqiC